MGGGVAKNIVLGVFFVAIGFGLAVPAALARTTLTADALTVRSGWRTRTIPLACIVSATAVRSGALVKYRDGDRTRTLVCGGTSGLVNPALFKGDTRVSRVADFINDRLPASHG